MTLYPDSENIPVDSPIIPLIIRMLKYVPYTLDLRSWTFTYLMINIFASALIPVFEIILFTIAVQYPTLTPKIRHKRCNSNSSRIRRRRWGKTLRRTITSFT